MAEVLVAMSGGVDSSVAAAMLIEAGHSVTGVTLKLWGGESDSGCCSVSDVDDARRVAYRLGIEHHVFNFGEEFNEFVVDPYITAHQQGETPNPCVECNRHLKFDKLMRRADTLGFEMVATGHHARITTSNGPDGTIVRNIARGHDEAKDQSYVLYMLDQPTLARLMLPVGDITKDDVRRLATDIGLNTADKPDSQDVCFISSKGGRQVFLGDRIPLSPARLVDVDGHQVGEVESIELVTLGQRRGLNLGGDEERRYVIDIDRAAQTVTVGHQHDLLVKTQPIKNLTWTNEPVGAQTQIQCSAHGRVRQGTVEGSMIHWSDPQPRVAPGQAVVVYQGDRVVGGAVTGRAT